ncbi:MAG TPA: hypothetical protein VN697_08155 [Tepidiformaceae bacterium]|jgi:hypothetical protein|nr:hypothetical protein [Tepidiformaceae bacterium]
MSWNPRTLMGEAVANVRSSAVRSAILFTALAVALGSLAYLEVHQASDLLAFESSFQSAGGYVSIVSAQGGVSAGRCEGLNRVPGVVAAGAERAEGQATFTSAPGVLYQEYGITTGLARVWATSSSVGNLPPTPGFFAGTALASELAVRGGLMLAREGESPLPLLAILDVSERAPQADRSLLEVVPPTGNADECWVEFTPQAFPGGSGALAAAFAGGNGTPSVRAYISPDQFSRNPANELAARPQRNGWAIVALLVAGIFVLVAWLRRAELGLYLALGTSRVTLATMLAMESWILVAAGWLTGVLWALAIQRATGHALTLGSIRLATVTSGSAALAVLVLAPMLSVLVARGSIANLLKDR